MSIIEEIFKFIFEWLIRGLVDGIYFFFKKVLDLSRKIIIRISQRKQKIISMILTMFLLSCTNQKENHDYSYQNEIENIITEMQQKIDSGALLYEYALIDKINNIADSIIINRYKMKINKLEHESIAAFERATALGLEGKITQEQYNSIQERVFLDSLQSKLLRLKQKGISFN